MTDEDDESLRTILTVGLVETVLPQTTPHHIMRLVNSAGNASPPLASDWASDSTGIRHRHDGWSSTLRGARVRLGEVCATRRPNVAIDADSADRRPMRTRSKEGISS